LEKVKKSAISDVRPIVTEPTSNDRVRPVEQDSSPFRAGNGEQTTALTPEPFPSHVCGALIMARSVVNEQLRNAIDTQQFSTELRSEQLELLLSQPAVE
jgi:hypothetical protein